MVTSYANEKLGEVQKKKSAKVGTVYEMSIKLGFFLTSSDSNLVGAASSTI